MAQHDQTFLLSSWVLDLLTALCDFDLAAPSRGL
jgi:hypothetical protein